MPEMLVAWRLVTWPNHSADFRRALYLRQFSNEARRIMAAMIRFLVALLGVGSYALILPNKPAALPAVATTVSGKQEPVATEPVEPVAEPVAEPVEPVATEPVEPVVAKEDEERVPEVQQEEEVDLDFGENDPNAPWNHMEKNPLDTEEFSSLCHGWGTFYVL